MPNYLRAFCQRANGDPGKPGEPIRFVASTEGVKRDGKNLEAGRWRLENYSKNPVFLWVHDYMGQTLPIGRATPVVEGAQLVADVTFDQEDEFARQVESKYRRGFLNAVSVGWDETKEGYELYDISAVPVPGDADALIERQYRALQELVGEGSWRELAAEMVAVFQPGSDDTDAERLRRYRALLPRYRRLGKQPPEFVEAAHLRGLGSKELAGLFLAGEWDLRAMDMEQMADKIGQMKAMCQEMLAAMSNMLDAVSGEAASADPGQEAGRGTRAGAVLSARNRDDLEQAATLIRAVLERAKKEEAGDAGERAMLGVLAELRDHMASLNV